jgi:hypothetical protein
LQQEELEDHTAGPRRENGGKNATQDASSAVHFPAELESSRNAMADVSGVAARAAPAAQGAQAAAAQRQQPKRVTKTK